MEKSLRNFILLISVLISCGVLAQEKDTVFQLTAEQVNENGYLDFPPVTEWKFKKGHDPKWADPNLNEAGWKRMDSLEIASLTYDENDRFEGWFRFRFRFEPNKEVPTPFLQSFNGAAQDIYLNGNLVASFGNTGSQSGNYRVNKGHLKHLPLQPGKEYLMAVHFKDWIGSLSRNVGTITVMGSRSFLTMTSDSKRISIEEERSKWRRINAVMFCIIALIALLFWLIFTLNSGEKYLLFVALLTTFIAIDSGISILYYQNTDYQFLNADWIAFRNIMLSFSAGAITVTFPLVLAAIYLPAIPKWLKWLTFVTLGILFPIYIFFASKSELVLQGVPILASLGASLASVFILLKSWKSIRGAKWIITAGLMLLLIVITSPIILALLGHEPSSILRVYYKYAAELIVPISLLIFVAFWIKESRLAERAQAEEVIRITKEKQALLAEQNVTLEKQVAVRTTELQTSLRNLKATQSQLIQAEKMASLGELTAGIAHEIQNPLNFVNNFSEVSEELVDEMQAEIKKGDLDEVKALGADLKKNLSKINHHGKRADSIVKGMLQHSRSSEGKKEPTDINALADEYLRLSYHGLRAKDKSFNADFKTELDGSLSKIEVVPQDIGRVLLNLINNAFYAVSEKKQTAGDDYLPTVKVTTKKSKKGVEIRVSDNGNGMPSEIQEKVFQPFFTTKPTGSGTGLGLSLSYDIVKAHGGKLTLNTKEGEGTEFVVELPG